MDKKIIKQLIKEAKTALKHYEKAFKGKFTYKQLTVLSINVGICHYSWIKELFLLEIELIEIKGYICCTPETVYCGKRSGLNLTNENKYFTKFKEPYEALEPRIDYLKKLITKYENQISRPTTPSSK